jgi:hypothetical protein
MSVAMSARFLVAGFLALLLSLVSAEISAAWVVGETVVTTSGKIEGHANPWKKSVSEYLGVPYAQPPVGDLRWEAPLPFAYTQKTVVASKFVGFVSRYSGSKANHIVSHRKPPLA